MRGCVEQPPGHSKYTWLDIRRRAIALMLIISRIKCAELLHTYLSLIPFLEIPLP
jgi:hypothetical protein